MDTGGFDFAAVTRFFQVSPFGSFFSEGSGISAYGGQQHHTNPRWRYLRRPAAYGAKGRWWTGGRTTQDFDEYSYDRLRPSPTLKIRSIASAPVVMTGRSSCR